MSQCMNDYKYPIPTIFFYTFYYQFNTPNHIKNKKNIDL